MSSLNSIPQWTRIVTHHLPSLSHPQARVLAAWSVALVQTGTCGQTVVSQFLAAITRAKPDAWRQRLREWTYEAAHKRGQHRQQIEVAACFAALLRWVLAWWDPAEKRLALAMDATTLGKRFTVLTISVVLHGCAIPIAWKIVDASASGAWKPYWLALLRQMANSVPSGWFVLVLADRGLYADWMFSAIQHQGWHPFLRINRQGLFQLASGSAWQSLASVTPRPNTQWSGRVQCFKGHPVTCSLLARWEAGYADPWLILTDLAPEHSEVLWYRLRSWIEQGFKDTKRGGWQWQHTRMTDPARAERLWLVLAVATLWVVSVGCLADTSNPLAALPAPPRRAGGRVLSVFAQGVLRLRAWGLSHRRLLVGRFTSFAWPTSDPVSFLAPAALSAALASNTSP